MSSTTSRRYRDFLRRLRRARKDAGWSQTEVARRLRRSQTWVSRSELGERRVDAVDLVDLCRLYGLAPQHFLPEFPSQE